MSDDLSHTEDTQRPPPNLDGDPVSRILAHDMTRHDFVFADRYNEQLDELVRKHPDFRPKAQFATSLCHILCSLVQEMLLTFETSLKTAFMRTGTHLNATQHRHWSDWIQCRGEGLEKWAKHLYHTDSAYHGRFVSDHLERIEGIVAHYVGVVRITINSFAFPLDKEPMQAVAAQRIHVSTLRDKLLMCGDTLRKYAALAGVPLAGRGKRNHTYTPNEVQAIVRCIAEHGSSPSQRDHATKVLVDLTKEIRNK